MSLDTNVLLLYVVGMTDPELVERHKRLSSYSPDDYRTLGDLVSRFRTMHSTAHVWTEVNNLASMSDRRATAGVRTTIRSLVRDWTEIPVPGRDAVNRDVYLTLGFTDAGIDSVCRKDGPVVVTDDVRLFVTLAASERPAINFSFLRETQ